MQLKHILASGLAASITLAIGAIFAGKQRLKTKERAAITSTKRPNKLIHGHVNQKFFEK